MTGKQKLEAIGQGIIAATGKVFINQIPYGISVTSEGYAISEDVFIILQWRRDGSLVGIVHPPESGKATPTFAARF